MTTEKTAEELLALVKNQPISSVTFHTTEGVGGLHASSIYVGEKAPTGGIGGQRMDVIERVDGGLLVIRAVSDAKGTTVHSSEVMYANIRRIERVPLLIPNEGNTPEGVQTIAPAEATVAPKRRGRPPKSESSNDVGVITVPDGD